MIKNYKYSIAICTKNRHLLLKSTLTTLLQRSIKSSNIIEIVVIDQSNDDKTSKIITTLKRNYRDFKIRYFKNKLHSISNSRNSAINKSSGELIIFVDDDVEVSPGWLNVVTEVTTKYQDVEVFGGKILLKFDIQKLFKCVSYISDSKTIWPFAVIDKGDKNIIYHDNVDSFFVTAMLVIRRRCFQKYGQFNTNFGNKNSILNIQWGEDTEFIYRLGRNGVKRMYHPKIKSYHLISKKRLSESYLIYKYYENGKENAYMDEIYQNKSLKKSRLIKHLRKMPLNIRRTISKIVFNRNQNIVNELELSYSIGYLFLSFIIYLDKNVFKTTIR